MRTMKFWRNILMMAAAVLSLASCSNDEDGDWDPMVWKAEVPVQKANGTYNVSADGETLTFTCRNYSSPWISSIAPDFEGSTKDNRRITADWFKVEMIGNKLDVSFEANETSEERALHLTVTAGDIFYTFRFKQFASRNAQKDNK